jgi:hypothetical protein
MFAMVSNVFQVFLQVFHMYVSNISFVFSCMLQLLHLDVSKLDQVLHPSPCLSVVLPPCQEAVPTSAGRPHVLAGRCSRRDMGGQARDARQGAAMWASGWGLASEHPGASHTHLKSNNYVMMVIYVL